MKRVLILLLFVLVIGCAEPDPPYESIDPTLSFPNPTEPTSPEAAEAAAKQAAAKQAAAKQAAAKKHAAKQAADSTY